MNKTLSDEIIGNPKALDEPVVKVKKLKASLKELKEEFCTGKEYDTIDKDFCELGQHYYCEECKKIDKIFGPKLTGEQDG